MKWNSAEGVWKSTQKWSSLIKFDASIIFVSFINVMKPNFLGQLINALNASLTHLSVACIWFLVLYHTALNQKSLPRDQSLVMISWYRQSRQCNPTNILPTKKKESRRRKAKTTIRLTTRLCGTGHSSYGKRKKWIWSSVLCSLLLLLQWRCWGIWRGERRKVLPISRY